MSAPIYLPSKKVSNLAPFPVPPPGFSVKMFISTLFL
jgi:hypothetical protein